MSETLEEVKKIMREEEVKVLEHILNSKKKDYISGNIENMNPRDLAFITKLIMELENINVQNN